MLQLLRKVKKTAKNMIHSAAERKEQLRSMKDIYGPPLPSARMILERAPSYRQEMLSMLERLDFDPYTQNVSRFHWQGMGKFGEGWDFVDLPLVALSASRLLEARDYLEIGVRRGRSLCCVCLGSKRVKMTGIDLWMPNYAGIPNPGPDFVRGEVGKLGRAERLELLTGNSHELMPTLAAASFDIVTVDGDHSEEGAMQDLKDAYRLVRPGGAILFDDISHPLHPYLETVWDRFVNELHLDHAEYRASGYGVGIAMKRYLQAQE